MDNRMVEIPATLTVDMGQLIDILREMTKEQGTSVRREVEPQPVGYERQGAGLIEEPPAKPPRKKPGPKPKAKPAEAAEPPPIEKKLRLKIDPNLSFVAQVKAAIVQVADQTFGDAVARSITNQWNAAADSGVTMLQQIFPRVGLATIAEATSEALEATLMGLPALFLQGIFAVANGLEEKATDVKVCGTCEGIGAHRPGCPIMMSERRDLLPSNDGGAIPSRVPNPTIPTPTRSAPPEGEICALAGPTGPIGCPIPQHNVVRQGGGHIYVHPPEVMAAIRAATAPAAAPGSAWNAPPPPGAARPPKPKRGRPKVKKS